ncbi:conserved hypothetical protein, secreted [mine drainage metagenome]|uniref:Uncharacterized protein n=1 Tax=mine drainage metagenome TaxID=410659 RepID=T0XYY8_9ZZZZ
MTRKLSQRISTVLLALALPIAAQAAGLGGAALKQTDTAIAHAGMALGAKELKIAHMHLHHVINCLVGPAGKDFNAHFADPCKGMGQGAIVDAKGNAEAETDLHGALQQAEMGLKTTTLMAAHADARQVMRTLHAAVAAK